MFGFFKRKKIETWEIDLLINVIANLPSEYSDLINQINDGLLRGVILDASDIPNYVAFLYNPSILEKYERRNEQNFKLTNIKVYDIKSLNFVQYEIYVSSGTINGYSLSGNKKHEIDVSKIDVSEFRKAYIGGSDYNRIANFFDEKEKKILNPSEVYSIFLDNKEFFHLRDLEDGDFIGID